MAAEEIRADYEQLSQAANRFATQGQQIQQMTQKVQKSEEMTDGSAHHSGRL